MLRFVEHCHTMRCIRYNTFILLICYIVCFINTTNSVENNTNSGVCRDRLGYFYPKDFKISGCSLCYFYLVVQDPAFVLDRDINVKQFHTEPYFLLRNPPESENSPRIYPAFDNQTSIEIVCDTLDEVTCTGWINCCNAAWDCCMTQISTKPPEDGTKYCPQTFDGWDCWGFTPPNCTMTQPCPQFLSSAEGKKSSKTCEANGAWKIDSNTGLEYTVYDECSVTDKKQMYKTPIIIGLVLNITGIVLVLPAISIYVMYRSLRRQHRIKIHVNFFLSILVTSILCMVWDISVRLDRLTTDQDKSFLHSQQDMCKTLHVLHRFARASMFFWMSCEGFFLHRLLVNAFSPPKRFYGYALYGWGVPVLLCGVYAGLRKQFADDSLCWILPLKDEKRSLDWVLLYSPSIACILVNIGFLCSIVKILVRKTTKHPNEPSNLRKIIKATFILVPLFGIHQFCLIYRPSSDTDPGYEVYELTSAIILNSQGIISSLLFCYFNTEVQTYVKLSFKRLGRRFSNRRTKDGRKFSLSTTSRRTSVSSLQTGGVATLYENGIAKSRPINKKDVKMYGNQPIKETDKEICGSRTWENRNQCYLQDTKIQINTNTQMQNTSDIPDFSQINTQQESVRL